MRKSQDEQLKSHSYEDYNKKAVNYDSTRSPVGVGFIAEQIKSLNLKMNEISLLDAGCGTGNYLQALRKKLPKIKLTGLEINDGMLALARKKLLHAEVNLRQGSLVNMRVFKENQFNVVIINQVLHHLTKPKESEPYQLIKQAFAEIHRVLQPNGMLLVNTCSHLQMREGFWYSPLMPKTIQKKMLPYLIPIDQMKQLLKEVGLTNVKTIVNTEALQALPVNLENKTLTAAIDINQLPPKGPLVASYRNADSLWAIAEATEKRQLQKSLKEMIEQKNIFTFFGNRQKRRLEIGQSTFVTSQKHVVENNNIANNMK